MRKPWARYIFYCFIAPFLVIPSKKTFKAHIYFHTLSGRTVTVSGLLLNQHFDYPPPPAWNSFSTQCMFSQIVPCLTESKEL